MTTELPADECAVLILHSNDNVAVARTTLPIGTTVNGLRTLAQIPSGNKVAMRAIKQGEPILKYNVVIGRAARDIPPGMWVHSHNMALEDQRHDYRFCEDYKPVALLPDNECARFMGIRRADGRVATRNYIGILSTVNCSATVVHMIAEHFTARVLADYPYVDGVVALSHSLGCGMEMSGEPMDLLRRTLAGYARHPNFAAVVVVGLGCERNQLRDMLAAEGLEQGPNLHGFVMQETGGTRRTIEEGVAVITSLLPQANQVQRESCSASHLVLGLQCGGSDGFSSISANPALGRAADLLIQHGGTAILSETPELHGVEHTLTCRAASRDVAERLLARLDWWKKVYAVGRDVQINGKVSPGNASGGLANIVEKSLGSSMKGGTSPLMEVYRYAEPVRTRGLVIMDTPGYDPVSVTGQIAGGANLIAFTTGRGSCFGSKPAPTIKLATNTPMYDRMQDDMDINCGKVIDGEETIDSMGQAIFRYFLRVASGERSKSELLGLGDHEFLPWQIGINS